MGEKKNVLYINGCVNRECSRTNRLAQAWIEKHLNKEQVTVYEVILEEKQLCGLNAEELSLRQEFCSRQEYSHPIFDYAKEFALADYIVVAAPYWDMSFPAIVKAYFERVSVCGLTFDYSKEGHPVGLCHASRLVYVTTSGGPIGTYNLGYDSVAALCNMYYGIKDTECISLEMLDIVGNDAKQMLQERIQLL